MNEKKLYWEASVRHSEADTTVYKTLDDACEALHEELGSLMSDFTEAEIEKDGFKVDLWIKPIRMTDQEFDNLSKDEL